MRRSKAPAAIVTGAANGIGRAIAQQLLAVGWRVVAVDLPKSGLTRAFPKTRRTIVGVEGDVADEDTARRAVRGATERFGRLDAVVSNAGIMVRKPLRRLTLGGGAR